MITTEMKVKKILESLMNKRIREFRIGFETLGSGIVQFGHCVNDLFLYPMKMFLPAKLGGGRFLFHASAYFKVEGEDDYGIAVEYGGKAKGSGYLPSQYKSIYNIFEKFQYGKEGGLRIRMLSDADFKSKCHTYFIDTMPLIITVKNIPTVKKLLETICKNSQWRKGDYEVLDHNCQDFVVQCIKELKAVRSEHLGYFRGYHNLALAHYPYCIIEQLEKNENDRSNDIDKIPILGPIEEGIRAFFGMFI